MRSLPPITEVKAHLFRVLGHPARVRILELLRDGERRSARCRPSSGSIRAGRRSISLRCGGSESCRVAPRGDERLLPRRGRAGVRPARRGPGDHRPAACDRAVDPARARGGVTAAFCSRPWRCSAPAAQRARAARTFRPGARGAGRGAALSGSRRLLGARVGDDVRRRVHERLDAAFRRRRPERRSSSARSAWSPRRRSPSRRAISSPERRGRSSPADGRVRARARRSAVRARSADVPGGLGADDAAAGGGDPRRRAADRARAADGLHLRRGHAPRRRRHLDRRPACSRTRARSAARRRSRPGSGLQVAIALAALVGHGHEGGRRCRCTSGCRVRIRSRRRPCRR